MITWSEVPEQLAWVAHAETLVRVSTGVEDWTIVPALFLYQA